jgi:sigma-54-interacting transcriptional regulator
MGTVTDTDVSLLQSFRTEWASLRVKWLNVILEGSCRATNAALSTLQPQMREPIVCSPAREFGLPSGDVRTLILKNVAGLNAADQTRLLAWIDRDGSGTQIISTSEHPLLAAVTRGTFEEALYYRLNLVLLRIDPRNAAALYAH